MTLRDEIARRAARLLAEGMLSCLRDAVRVAAEELRAGAEDLPSDALVRRHAQALAQQELGNEGYAALVGSRLRLAEGLLTLLDFEFPGAELRLVGRAARGQVDADPHLRIRFLGDAPISEIARRLVEHGYEEPVFEVIETRWGRLERLCFREQDVRCSITRCPPAQVRRPEEDLFTGRPVRQITLDELRRLIAALDRGDQPRPPLS